MSVRCQDISSDLRFGQPIGFDQFQSKLNETNYKVSKFVKTIRNYNFDKVDIILSINLFLNLPCGFMPVNAEAFGVNRLFIKNLNLFYWIN